MRAALVIVGMILSASTATAQESYVKGNDTGGMISWSCEAEAAAPAIAAAHCAQFDKFSRITGVHRQYGDYITFHCLWNPRMARYALPAVSTRSVCPIRALN